MSRLANLFSKAKHALHTTKATRDERVRKKSSDSGNSPNTETVQEHAFIGVATDQSTKSVASSHHSVDVETSIEHATTSPEEPVQCFNARPSTSDESAQSQPVRDGQKPVGESSSVPREASPEIEVSTSDRVTKFCQHSLTTKGAA